MNDGENNIEYAFLRSEKDSEILLFVEIKNEWLSKEIGVFFQNDRLIIEVEKEKFTTNTMPIVLSNYIKENSIKTYFTQEDGLVVTESVLEYDK